MDQQDKQIRIKISTDDASVHKFKSTLNTMNAAAKQLADTMDRVTRSVEGFTKAQSKMKPGGMPSTKSSKGGISETVIGDGTAVQAAAKATERALQATGENIKKFVDRALQDIARLNAARGSVGGGGGGNYAPNYGGGWASSTGGSLTPQRGAYSDFERDMLNIQPPIPKKGSANRGGFWTGQRSWGDPLFVLPDEAKASKFWGPRGFAGYLEGRGEALGGVLGLPPGGQQALGRVGKTIGGSVGVLGGAAIGGLIAYNYGATSFENLRAERINYAQNVPFMKLQSAANSASIFTSHFRDLQQGNVARVMAFDKAMKNPEVMKSLASVSLDKEKLLLAYSSNPLSGSSGIKWIKDRLQAGASGGFEWFQQLVNSDNTLDPTTKKTMLQMGQSAAIAGLSGKKAEQFNQAVESHMALTNPLLNQMANDVYGGSMDRLRTMRLAGMSTGVNPRTGKLRFEEMGANLRARGWGREDYVSGYQRLLNGIGGGYSKAIGPIGLVGTTMAGFGNIDQLVQMGAIMGGSVGMGRSMYETVQHRGVGRGGLDVATGRDLFGAFGSRMMGSGQFGMSGNAAETFFAAAAGLVGGGENGRATLDVAQQQRRMGLLINGASTFGGITGGSQAPLYSATSTIAAINAMGGNWSVASHNLSQMDPTLLTAIARGGDVPAWAAAQGIGQEQARDFLRQNRRVSFSEVVDDSVRGLPIENLVAKVRDDETKGGSFINTILRETRGDKNRALSIQKKVEELSGVLAPFLNVSKDEAAGLLFFQLSQADVFASSLKSSGVGVSGPKGPEAAALGEQADLEDEQATFGGKNAKLLSDVYKNFRTKSRASQLGVSNAAMSAGAEIDALTQNFISAVTQYSEFVKANVPRSKPNMSVATPK